MGIPPVSLKGLVEGLEAQVDSPKDAIVTYVNRNTGEVRNCYEPETPESDPGDWAVLSSNSSIPPWWRMAGAFSESGFEDHVKQALNQGVFSGPGGFQGALGACGLEYQWHKFKRLRLEEIARSVLEAAGIPYRAEMTLIDDLLFIGQFKVMLVLVNSLAATISVGSSASIVIFDGSPSVWAPFHLSTGLPMEQRDHERNQPFQIEAGATFAAQIDLSRLRWARSVSPSWPSESLKSLVSPGHYRLRVHAAAENSGMIGIDVD